MSSACVSYRLIMDFLLSFSKERCHLQGFPCMVPKYSFISLNKQGMGDSVVKHSARGTGKMLEPDFGFLRRDPPSPIA